MKLKQVRFTEPALAPVYDPREAESNALIGELDAIEEDIRRNPRYAHSQLEMLRKHFLPRVRRAMRERWPYAREVAASYRRARRAAMSAAGRARDPMTDREFRALGGRFYIQKYGLTRAEAERLLLNPARETIENRVEDFRERHGWIDPQSPLARGYLLSLMREGGRDRGRRRRSA
jgi:hypothetical protein